MEPPQEPGRAVEEHRCEPPLHGIPGQRGSGRQHRRRPRAPHTARRHGADLDHARRDPEEDLRVEDGVLGRPSLRLALRSDAGRDESRQRHDRPRQARHTLGRIACTSASGSWPRCSSPSPPRRSRRRAKATNLYLHADGTLSFDAPAPEARGATYRAYVSDPANPVPYRQRTFTPTYPVGDLRTWEVQDQRFVDQRPDVVTFVSVPLDHDLTITGEVAADLFVSTSGSDADVVVKLIDVYPEDAQPNSWDPESGPAPGQYARSVNGYELPIAMEVRRGRYLASYEHPHPLTPNTALEWKIPLRDRDHVFLKGHRLMVQVQSTWFPLIDRNPQKFVPSIYAATAADFVKATQRVYCSPTLPSHIALPVVPYVGLEVRAGLGSGL